MADVRFFADQSACPDVWLDGKLLKTDRRREIFETGVLNGNSELSPAGCGRKTYAQRLQGALKNKKPVSRSVSAYILIRQGGIGKKP